MNSHWQSVIGHDWAVHMLRGAIEHGRVGHAYLFTGPDQVGKTTLARSFAQTLNCTADSSKERPCGSCRACDLIATDRHPDVRIVEPEIGGRGKPTLRIESIRTLQRDLNLSAYEGRHKIAILKRFDTATPGAANAFLKTLEEPPSAVILLLTAKDADSLLPTISSRCHIIGLRPLSKELIEHSLQARWHVSEEDSHLLAHLADGRLGWAVNAAADAQLLENRGEHLALLYEALAGRRVARFALADRLSRKPEAIPALLRDWLSWWRDGSLLSSQIQQSPFDGEAAGLLITNVDHASELKSFVRKWQAEQLFAGYKRTNHAIWQLEHNANTRLLMENLLLEYPIEPA